MALFDFFKKNKEQADTRKQKLQKGATSKKRREKSVPAKTPAAKKKSPAKTAVAKKEIENLLNALTLKRPRITEKATYLAEGNQYVFEVDNRANKNEIKKSVESLYGIKVLRVNIINIPRKRKRRGRVVGWRSGMKKAIVKIGKGERIEVIPR